MKLLKKILQNSFFQTIDWSLLLFLILFLNVKFYIKIPAILFFVLQKGKSYSPATLKKEKIFWFYIGVILISILNLFLNIHHITSSYLLLLTIGISYWLLMLGAAFFTFNSVKNNTPATTYNTITLFFIINVLVSFIQLFLIIIETGSLNPYAYQGLFQKYFINTGDFIRGLSFDTSTTNALINAFAIMYFLFRRNFWLSIICTAAFLFTGSNMTNLLVIAVLLFTFIFYSDRLQKSIISIQLFLVIIFMSKISSQNSEYLINILNRTFTTGKITITQKDSVIDIRKKPESLLTPDEQKVKIATLYLDSLSNHTNKRDQDKGANNVNAPKKINIPAENKYTPFYERKKDSTEKQKMFASLNNDVKIRSNSTVASKIHIDSFKGPGKLIAYKQTVTFLKIHPEKILTGNGLGNFSSKLAFKATGLNIAGGYFQGYKYIHPDFKKNHFLIYTNFFSKDEGEHSVINTPNSVFNQFLGEYGIVGVFVLISFYFLYFLKKIRQLTFGIPVLILLCGAFLIDYWFEQLSIVILFELLLFADNIPKKSILNSPAKNDY